MDILRHMLRFFRGRCERGLFTAALCVFITAVPICTDGIGAHPENFPLHLFAHDTSKPDFSCARAFGSRCGTAHGFQRAGAEHNWPRRGGRWKLHARGSQINLSHVDAVFGTPGDVLFASMPAAARPHCIQCAKDLRKMAFVFGLSRWSQNFGRLFPFIGFAPGAFLFRRPGVIRVIRDLLPPLHLC